MSKLLVFASSVVGIYLLILIGGAIRTRWRRYSTTKKLREVEWSRPHPKVQPESFATMPLPVQNYLRSVIKDGTQLIRFATVKQKGEFRSLSQPKWGKLSATTSFTGTIPGLIWDAMIYISPLSWTTAHLLYNSGTGSGSMKFMGMFTMFDPRGKEVGFALLTRFLMEIVWVPTALITGPMLKWESINSNTARGVLTHDGKTISADFFFNDNNEVERIVTHDKYRDTGTSYEREQCTMYCTDYKWFGEVKIPTSVRIEWNLEEDDFEYARINVTDLRYE